MNNIEALIGINAGKIWRSLNFSGSLTLYQLINETKLSEDEVFQAIGWLAKENKINKDGEFYSLDNTNLSENIENNAGKISNLFKNEKINIFELKNITKMNEENYNLALGWLAREGIIENELIKEISNSISNNFEITNLKNEIDSLINNIEIRDTIINKLKEQISLNQFNNINDKNNFISLSNEIKNKNKIIFKQKNKIKLKKQKIEDLKTEVSILNSDINSRNLIIKQITIQLNDKQTQFIEKTDTINKLKIELNENKNLIKIANEKLNDRINMISSLQSDIKNEKIEENISNSTLFSKPGSLIDKEINSINNNIDHKNENSNNNIDCESNRMQSSLKNKKNQTE
jgi:hypothetical protein